MSRFRIMFSNKNFTFLWLGQIISNFGDRLNQMALVALVYQRNPGSEMALATLISFTIIPVFVIGPIAGVWVDRFDRRKVMIFSDLVRGLLVLSIPFFIYANQILPIYLVIFMTFSLSRFFIPSKMAIIPEIVSRESLLIANTLHGTTNMIGNVAGLVVAGIIVNIRYIGAVGGFFIDAATFFISATLISMMTRGGFVKDMKNGIAMSAAAIKMSVRRSFISEIREGLGYLTAAKDMRLVMGAFFLLMAGLGAISCVIIVFIQSAFGSSTRDLGFVGMFFVAGLFLGTLAFGRLGQRIPKRRAIYLSFIEAGVFIALFAFIVQRYPNLVIAGVLSALLGAAASPIMVITNTLTHEAIPEAVRGRIFSSLEVIIHISFLAFMFLAAFAAKYVDRMWILVAAGVVFSVCGIVGVFTEEKKLPI